jgi:hypothetical protein
MRLVIHVTVSTPSNCFFYAKDVNYTAETLCKNIVREHEDWSKNVFTLYPERTLTVIRSR